MLGEKSISSEKRFCEGIAAAVNLVVTCEILAPCAIGGYQILTDAALGRVGQQGPALFKVVLEMRRLPVSLQGGLVSVDLVEIETVLIVLVLDYVEAQAARLVLLRMLGVVTDDFQEFLHVFRFYLDGHM